MSAVTAERSGPKITGFVCDCTGTSYVQADVRIVRIPCAGRLDPLFIVKAFERGSDGVIIRGCWADEHTRRRFDVAHEIFDFMGIDRRRITLSWLPATDGMDWRALVNDAIGRAKDAGAFVQYQALARSQA